MHVITVTRNTTAKPEVIWELFTDVKNRIRWDDSLEHAKLDGAFQSGVFGVVKLKGQPERKFKILECIPMKKYTDRFFLPMGGKMDWVHNIKEVKDGCEITFDVSVNGPTAFILKLIMKKILGHELPPTVEKLISIAEQL